MPDPYSIEGYAIISEDGMIANAAGIMPASLKFEADKRFFERALDGVDVVVHGRHSHEQQPRSHLRHRIVLTRTITTVSPHPSDQKAVLWHPAGASFEAALAALGIMAQRIGVIGGPDVFDLFLDRYDAFHLSRAPRVTLPGGHPVFRDVPASTPEQVLAAHGLESRARQALDSAHGVTLVTWQRSSVPE
jgi:dihydrofolate reductase